MEYEQLQNTIIDAPRSGPPAGWRREVQDEIVAMRPDMPVFFQTGYDLKKIDAEFPGGRNLTMLCKSISPNQLRSAVANLLGTGNSAAVSGPWNK